MPMNKMKNTGKIIMFIGTILVLAAMVLFCFNLYTQQSAAKHSSDVLEKLDISVVESDEELTPDYLLNPYIDMPEQNVDGVAYSGILSIPSLSITLPVAAECSTDNLKKAPCIYSGTPYREKMIVAGHNYKTHFGPIDNLKKGDIIIFTDFDGNEFRYEVIYTEIIEETDTEKMNDGEWDLSLFTCTYSGTERITVRCMKMQ